tara:strand:+ start:216 stop:1901 length:1686 start_codon:yes stop_codon:yes gene_type:complete
MFFRNNNNFIKKYFIKELFFILITSLIFNFSTIGSLPTLDRDEARYVQASKQMIETKNHFSVRFQEEFRSKKPIGIYWLQSYLVKHISVLEQVDNGKFKILNNHIWKYRLVSAIASLLSILILFYLSNKIFSRKIAYISSLILSCTLIFVTESHIAKTDSALLTCSITIMLILAGYYLGYFKKTNIIAFLIFWIFTSISILLKGPIILIIIVLCLLFIYIIEKDIKWIRNSSPVIGLIITSTLIIPIFYYLMRTGQENFLKESLVNDLFKKVISPEENHGAFFGAHLLSSWFLFFPMAMFIVPTFLFIKKNISDKKVFFLAAWIIPNFLILELIPTKLPHYTLPLYPAFCILVAMLLTQVNNNDDIFRSNLSKLGYIFSYFISTLFIFLLSFGVLKFGNLDKKIIILTIILFLFNTYSFYILYRKKILLLFKYQIAISAFIYIAIFSIYLPNMEKLWISKKISETINRYDNHHNSKNIASLGYNEPSLVFELGTNLNILKNINDIPNNLEELKFVILEEKFYENFIEILQNNDIKYILLNEFNGYNSAKSKWIKIYIFKIL